MYSSRGCVENRCVSTPAKKGPTWSHVPWTAGQGLFCFFSLRTCSTICPFRVWATGNKAQKNQNKQVDSSSQPGSKPKTTTRVRVLQPARFGYTGASGNEADQIQNKQVDNSSLYQTKPKTTRLQKRVSCGMVLMASTMLHEKCCNTVLQIGAPAFRVRAALCGLFTGLVSFRCLAFPVVYCMYSTCDLHFYSYFIVVYCRVNYDEEGIFVVLM